MEDYLKHIEIFHRDLLSSQSNKEKYIRCKGCDDTKKFIINENELIYSCGSTHSGPCGDQFKINIPDYIHYEKIMKTFNETINGSFNYEPNIKDLSEYDIEELSKYMKLDDEVKEYNELKETIKKDSQKFISLFNSSNQLKQYYDSLNELNNSIQKYNLKKKKILFDLQNEQLLTLEDKLKLRKEYAKIIHNEKYETYPIYESLINHTNNQYLLLNVKEKYVEKYQSKYLEIQNTRTKKKSKKDKKVKKKDDAEVIDEEISKKQSNKSSKSK